MQRLTIQRLFNGRIVVELNDEKIENVSLLELEFVQDNDDKEKVAYFLKIDFDEDVLATDIE